MPRYILYLFLLYKWRWRSLPWQPCLESKKTPLIDILISQILHSMLPRSSQQHLVLAFPVESSSVETWRDVMVEVLWIIILLTSCQRWSDELIKCSGHLSSTNLSQFTWTMLVHFTVEGGSLKKISLIPWKEPMISYNICLYSDADIMLCFLQQTGWILLVFSWHVFKSICDIQYLR